MKSFRIFLFIVLCSCNQKQNIEEIPVIDIQKALDTKQEMFLSEIASHIEYVKLETTPDCLFGKAWRIKIRENYIYILAPDPIRILIFTRDGKFIRTINKYGKGPGEYLNIWTWQVSPYGKKLFISDMRKDELLLYSVKGEFLGNIKSLNGSYFNQNRIFK